MSLGKPEVQRVAKLARLRPTEADVERLAAQFGDILGYMERLGAIDTNAVEPMYSPVAHAQDVTGLIGDYATRAGLSAAPDSQSLALAERLIHAAAFQFGLVIEITIAAIEVALLEEATCLEGRHFELAYEHRSSCSDAFNPFIVTDYQRIDARKVFIREAP